MEDEALYKLLSKVGELTSLQFKMFPDGMTGPQT